VDLGRTDRIISYFTGAVTHGKGDWIRGTGVGSRAAGLEMGKVVVS
jgi:hypothetical protein